MTITDITALYCTGYTGYKATSAVVERERERRVLSDLCSARPISVFSVVFLLLLPFLLLISAEEERRGKPGGSGLEMPHCGYLI